MSKRKRQGDVMSDETTHTGETPVPQNDAVPQNGTTIRVRKARGGEGINRSLDCYVRIGDEIEVSVEMAALCVIGGEFDVPDAGQAERIEAEVARIRQRDVETPSAATTEN